MKKAINTFEGYQEAKQCRRESLIAGYLDQLRVSRVKFPHVTGLAEMVARYVAHCEQGACNRATLLRNIRYKALLLTYMAEKGQGGVKGRRIDGDRGARSKAIVVGAELEAINAKREVNRLKAYIAHLEGVPRALKAGADSDRDVDKQLLELQVKHANTCQALDLILSHFGNVLAVDAEGERVIDLSSLRNNILLDARLGAAYFEWLRISRLRVRG